MTLFERFALCMTLALSVPTLSQSPSPAHRAPSSGVIGNTISVSALHISPRAWEHFNNAKQADQADRSADFNREFDRALAIAPNFGSLYLLRATRELRLHQFDTAQSDVLAAQRVEPGLTGAATILAGIYTGLHRFQDALLVLNAVHGAEAGTWQVAYEFTRAYLGRLDAEQALRTSALTLKMAPEGCHEALLLRANALYLADRTEEAVDQFRLFLSFNHDTATALQVQRAIDSIGKIDRIGKTDPIGNQTAQQQQTTVASN